MPRASKPIDTVQGHRTKAELELRKAAEDKLKTGGELIEKSETEKNIIAHQEFLRIKELLKVIEKSDALYSSVINRYCIITAECADFEKRIEKLKERLERLEADYDNEKIQPDFYYSKLDSLQKSIIGYDRQIMTKRKMLFDIEKENVMTVAAGLRSVPKNPTQTDENPLLKALIDDDD